MIDAPIVCYHGSPGLPDEFVALQDHLTTRRVVRLVRKGYPDAASAPRQARLAEPSVLLGYSWGAVEALRDAAGSPADVVAVILVSPYLRPRKKLGALKKTLLRIPWLGDVLLSRAGEKIVRQMLEETSSPAAIPAGYSRVAERLARPAMLRRAALEKEEPGPTAAAALATLAEAGVPVGLVSGSDDRTSSRSLQLEPIRGAIRLAMDVQIPAAGHALPWTHPAETAAAIERFLASISPRTRRPGPSRPSEELR